MSRVSTEPTPWAVICYRHKQVFLTKAEYMRQLSKPNSFWVCPSCGEEADWDDENYSTYGEEEEEEESSPA